MHGCRSRRQPLGSDPAPAKFFGIPVATDETTTVVSATFDGQAGIRAGAVYVFVKRNGDWVQGAKLVGSDTAAEDQFGFSVALENGTLLIGAPFHDAGHLDAGAAYIFQKGAQGWHQDVKLTSSDADAGDLFAFLVSLSGNMAVIGAHGNSDAGLRSGSAYYSSA